MADIVAQILDTLAKSRPELSKNMGLGSRGGQVLGMTRRGHAIYAHAAANSYQHFNRDDHKDAMMAHMRHQTSTADRKQSVFSEHQALIHHTMHAFGRN